MKKVGNETKGRLKGGKRAEFGTQWNFAKKTHVPTVDLRGSSRVESSPRYPAAQQKAGSVSIERFRILSLRPENESLSPTPAVLLADLDFVNSSDSPASECGESRLKVLNIWLANLAEHFTVKLVVIAIEIREQGNVAQDYGWQNIRPHQEKAVNHSGAGIAIWISGKGVTKESESYGCTSIKSTLLILSGHTCQNRPGSETHVSF